MVVVLLGPPGVGKGTQGARLAEGLGWERLATGDLLRQARREGTALGREAEGFMDKGELVPDDLIVRMMEERLDSLGPEDGVFLDGFPRTRAQAEALERMLPRVGRKVRAVLLFEAPDEVLVKRISGRRHSPDSGRVYNVHFDPPQREGICDETGTPLVHREDDRPETVERRLVVYREQTAPLIAYYAEHEAPLLTVDADRPIDEVQENARRVLTEALEQSEGAQ